MEEIEYVTGATDTNWGAARARDGHPAPFALRYVEIGNEDNFDRANTYDGRYAQFYNAIKAKYPKLQVIATMPVNGMKPDIVDDYYYKREQGMFAEALHYDNVDRNGPKIFVGEWATCEGSPPPNFGAALGDGFLDRTRAQQRRRHNGVLCAVVRQRESPAVCSGVPI